MTLLPELLNLEKSDLFTFQNIAKSVKLNKSTADTDNADGEAWYAVIQLLPLSFYRIIESIPDMYTIEKFDYKYLRNPKRCAYDRYGTTNMWRPLMILNRCPKITSFEFEYIRYFNIEKFSSIMSTLMSRMDDLSL